MIKAKTKRSWKNHIIHGVGEWYLKGCSMPKRDAIHLDGISFWSTDPAMNLWFDRPAILCEAQRLRIAQTVLSV